MPKPRAATESRLSSPGDRRGKGTLALVCGHAGIALSGPRLHPEQRLQIACKFFVDLAKLCDGFAVIVALYMVSQRTATEDIGGGDPRVHAQGHEPSPTLFPPLPSSEDGTLALAIQQATADLGEAVPDVSGVAGATDAAWYAARGIPAVI